MNCFNHFFITFTRSHTELSVKWEKSTTTEKKVGDNEWARALHLVKLRNPRYLCHVNEFWSLFPVCAVAWQFGEMKISILINWTSRRCFVFRLLLVLWMMRLENGNFRTFTSVGQKIDQTIRHFSFLRTLWSNFGIIYTKRRVVSSEVWREKVSSHYYFALKFRRSQNVRKYANWVAQRSVHKTVFSSLLCNDCDNFMFNLETNATTELQTIHRNFREFLQIQRERENAQNARKTL